MIYGKTATMGVFSVLFLDWQIGIDLDFGILMSNASKNTARKLKNKKRETVGLYVPCFFRIPDSRLSCVSRYFVDDA